MRMFQEQPTVPEIVLVVASEVANQKLMNDTVIAKRADSMATSTIRFLFQSAYVLSIKIHSEKVSDTTPRHE